VNVQDFNNMRAEYSKLICPCCGCELWIIGNTIFTCFLCRSTFFGKELLLNNNMKEANHLLSQSFHGENNGEESNS
jgi:hypothetical protein